jgi:putative copper export protein
MHLVVTKLPYTSTNAKFAQALTRVGFCRVTGSVLYTVACVGHGAVHTKNAHTQAMNVCCAEK